MKSELKKENINPFNYFQRDLFLNEKNSIFVYDLEKIIKKDKTYSFIRDLEEIDWLHASPEEDNFIKESEDIYDLFLWNMNSIIEIIDENLILNEYYLENNKIPKFHELAQLSKWFKTNKKDLKKGSVFLDELEFVELKKDYHKSLKLKQEFIEAHFFLCLRCAWKYNGEYTGKDIIELSFISKIKLYESIETFFENLRLIKNNWAEKLANDKKKINWWEAKKTMSDDDFDGCIYANDFLNAYLEFISKTKKDIEVHILSYLINEIDFSENGEFVFQNKTF